MMKRRLLAVGAAAMMLGACGILDADGDGDSAAVNDVQPGDAGDSADQDDVAGADEDGDADADDDEAETGTASVDESEPYVLVDGEVRHILRTGCFEIYGDDHGLNQVVSYLETEDGSLNERIRIEAWTGSDGVQTWDNVNVLFDGIGGWEDNNSDTVMASETGAAGSTVFDNEALRNMDEVPYGDEIEVEYNLVCTEWLDPEEAREAD